MKKNTKRKGNHIWIFEAYKYGGVYARCSCGFSYSCNYHILDQIETESVIVVPDLDTVYNFCPHCGVKKKRYYDGVDYIDKNPPWFHL